jgi:hypothetical protein
MTEHEFDIPTPTYRVERPALSAGSGGGRKLGMIAGGVGGALVLVYAVSAVFGHRGPIPVVEADSSPIRVRPDNPGGMSVVGGEEDILAGAAAANSGGRLAPGAEAPALQALRAEQARGGQAATAEPSAPAAQVAAASAGSPPVATADANAAPVARSATQRPPASAVAANSSPLPPVARQGRVERAAASIPMPPSHPAPQAAAPAQPAVANPAPHSGGHAQVQLAAVDNEAGAHAEWDRLAKRAPDLLAGRQPSFVKFDKDGKTYWRIRTGGFADIAAATQFCAQLRAKGGSCSLASF